MKDYEDNKWSNFWSISPGKTAEKEAQTRYEVVKSALEKARLAAGLAFITPSTDLYLSQSLRYRLKLTLFQAVKLGVMCSGKELGSETAKHKRCRLIGETLYGGIEEP